MDIARPDLAVAISCIIAAFGGITANGMLLAVILSKKELRRKGYIAFIVNRSMYDMLFSISLATLQPIAILATESTSTLCVVTAFLAIACVVGSISSELLLACNRYVSLLKSDKYQAIYKTRNIHVTLACIPVVAVLSATPHAFTNSLGRVTGAFCSARFSTDTFLVVVTTNYTFLLANFGLMLYFNFKMYFYIKKYQSQPMTNSQRTQLQSDREMLRYIFVVAFLPLIFQSPVMIVCFVQMVRPVSAWLIFAGMCPLLISFAACPVITLTMVRPIRVQAVTRLKKTFQHDMSVSRVEPADLGDYGR